MTRINIIFICLFVLCIEPLFFSAFERYYQQELENNPNHVIPAGCYTKFTSMVDSLIAMGDTVKVRKTNYRVEYKGKSDDKPEYPYKYELVGSPWTYSHIYSSKGWYTSGTTYPLRIYAKSPISSDEEIKTCIDMSYKLYRDSVSKSSDGSYDEVYDKYNNAAKLLLVMYYMDMVMAISYMKLWIKSCLISIWSFCHNVVFVRFHHFWIGIIAN